ncbi:hypothetical protein DWUX_335 [Desulfovibrio diazotrophicus]|nr:hypothetical protein DWUX_335 [Desulfovibrio diazotrophicus]
MLVGRGAVFGQLRLQQVRRSALFGFNSLELHQLVGKISVFIKPFRISHCILRRIKIWACRSTLLSHCRKSACTLGTSSKPTSQGPVDSKHLPSHDPGVATTCEAFLSDFPPTSAAPRKSTCRAGGSELAVATRCAAAISPTDQPADVLLRMARSARPTGSPSRWSWTHVAIEYTPA